MYRTVGRRVVAVTLALTLGVVLVGVSPGVAGAQTVTHTFPQVQCTAVVQGSTISQQQDITVSMTAPDQVAPGQQFTVLYPSETTILPSSSNGFRITSYSNLSLSYEIHSTTFDKGTIVNPGTATIDGNPTRETATLPTPTSIKLGQPGPFPPGTLVTPDVTVKATAGPAGTPITLNALALTTTVVLNGSITANVTCNIPRDTLMTIPVATPNPPPTVDAGPDASGPVNGSIPLAGVVTDAFTDPTVAWTMSNPACVVANPSSPSTSVTCSAMGTYTATLTANDGTNPPVSDSTVVTVTKATGLTVNAGGPVAGIELHQIALHGAATDPDHSLTIAWTIDSASCNFADAASASTTVVCSAVGTYTATLRADNGVDPPLSDTAQVTVAPDLPPTVSAGPDIAGDTGAPLTLTGIAADPEHDPLSIHWSADNPVCTFSDPTKAVTTITCSVQGNYTATLTVDDGYNPTVTDAAAAVVTDILFPFNWNVDATTHLKTLNQDVTIPTGTFNGIVDLTTGELSGDITLPPAQTTMSLASFGLVTANMQITETQPVTGQLDTSTFDVTSTAVFNIRILSAYPSATPTVNIVGNKCVTSQPVSVTMQGTANLAGASTFTGDYTIPPLKTCGLATTALNLVIPGPGNTFSATVQPPPAAPAVVAQPSDQTVTTDETYSFSAAASGYPPPSVQWQVSTDGGSNFANIAGATDPTYTGTATLGDSGKQFRAVFTNASGSATTDAAKLIVAVVPDAPAIGNATAGDSAATVTFSPPAHDGDSPVIDYTTDCTSANGAPGTAAADSSPITVTGLTPSASYTCTVSARNVIGSSAPSAASNAVVPTAPPNITVQPANSSVSSGDSYSFSAAATGSPPPTAQWQVSTDGGNTYTDIPGATTDTLTRTAALGDSGRRFRAVYANTEGTATTDAAVLTVSLPHSIAIADASIAEGDSGPLRKAMLAVTLSQPAGQDVTVNYATSDATADAADYVAKKGKLTIKAGKTTQVVPVSVKPDTDVEPNQTLRVTLSGPTGGYTLATNRSVGVLTILNDDTNSGTRVSIGDAAICEGDVGPAGVAKILVSLSAPATTTLTVQITLAPGTATGGVDYKSWTTKTLTFKSGQFQKAIAITVNRDTNQEPNETVFLTLSNPGPGLVLGRATGTLTITNDD